MAQISYPIAQIARIRSWLKPRLSRSASSGDFRAAGTALASGGESNGRRAVGSAPTAGFLAGAGFFAAGGRSTWAGAPARLLLIVSSAFSAPAILSLAVDLFSG